MREITVRGIATIVIVRKRRRERTIRPGWVIMY